ncbi:MAG: hypothetical protein PF442_06770 [Desulfobulbaceae bacterium]|jgi:hypothetical protein|nr:hypothetical protein [Desulfobulbaceae bacterium]
MDFSIILKYKGAITAITSIAALIGAIFTIRKFYYWLNPVHIEPSFTINFSNNVLDEIGATIVNRSNESIYLVNCVARGTYSFKHIALMHLKRPLTPIRLYQNIRFGPVVYELLENENLKLEQNQPVNLKCVIPEHPLNAMYNPYFLIEAKLSSGKLIRSKKLKTPTVWKQIGNREIT